MTGPHDDRTADALPPRLIRMHVSGLLDRFDHVVEFPEPWEYVILHGPNGVGKTKLLELASAIFAPSPKRVMAIPFEFASFEFNDGSSLHVEVEQHSREPKAGDEVRSARMQLTFLDRGGVSHMWRSPPRVVRYTRQMLLRLAESAPVRRIGPNLWRDLELHDHIDDNELFERYSHILGVDEALTELMPPELEKFLADIKVYLIETHRLFLHGASRSAMEVRRGVPRRTSRVSEYAGNLAQRISHALTTNSTTSQQLERSFPRRLLERGIPSELATQGEIREIYDRQRNTRNALSDIGILDTGEDLPLPTRPLADWERAVLSTYLEDAEEKLGTFSDISMRAMLFRDIINSRFKYKEMRLDRVRGYFFVTRNGQTQLSPAQLSSGEQHELVLVYDLIFNVKPGTLVLIDEPEISLHVGWQQQFLMDITQISHVNDLRFIVATHSPQIIHKSWSRTVQLAALED